MSSTGTRIRYLELDQARCVSMYLLGDLQNSLKRLGMECLGHRNANSLLPRLLSKLRFGRRYWPQPKEVFFAGMMGPSESFLIPYCFRMEPVVYCFDCWPPQYRWWEQFFQRHKIRSAFFSARQSAEFFRHKVPGLDATWIPEATDLGKYDASAPLESRTLNVLELGRRYEWFHSRVKDAVRNARQTHRFETSGIVFKTRAELQQGLADTQVSICFPRSITHPESAGQVETVTQRYFESMASGCLIYGHCPHELQDLFGYNPIVEMDATDPVGQLLALLKNMSSYQGLVDKNLASMRLVGTWDSRAAAIKRVLDRLELEMGPTSKRESP